MKMKLFVLSLLVVWLPVNAEVFRWIDEQGNVHFGDKPPSEQAEKVTIRRSPAEPTTVTPADRQEKQNRLLNAYREERLQKEEEKRKAAKKRAEQQRACAEVRDDYRQYERSSGIYDLDKKGNRIYMDEGQREAFMEKLRADIRRYCQ